MLNYLNMHNQTWLQQLNTGYWLLVVRSWLGYGYWLFVSKTPGEMSGPYAIECWGND